MKKLLSYCIVIALVVTSFTGWSMQTSKASDSIKTAPLNLVCYFNKVKIKLPKRKNVAFYKIYKVRVTKKVVKSNGYEIARKKYKKLATVSASKKSYNDKKVKRNKEYAYFIDGYKKKKGGKYSLVFTTYRDMYDSAYTGLVKPDITSQYSDNYNNDATYVHFHISSSAGIKPTKYIVYRKASTETKYKKLKIKPMPNSDDDPTLYGDSGLTPNTTYKYKAKAYYKKGKKKYYSKYSNVFKITPCNDVAKFTVTSLTEPGNNVSEFVLKVAGQKNNGKTKFYYTSSGEDYDEYRLTDNTDKNSSYWIRVTEYSLDNKVWKSLKDTSITTMSNEIIYLKFQMTRKSDDTSSEFNYGSNKAKRSELEMSSISYAGPNPGSSKLYFDIAKGTGTASTYTD